MKYGVFIGRFQPVTLAHTKIINYSFKKYDKLIVIIGSSKSTCTTRNPFDLETRINMIHAVATDTNKLFIKSVPDSNYNFSQWILNIQEIVNSIIITDKDRIGQSAEITLINSYKDAGSYWINYFPQWKVDASYSGKDPSGTDIRKLLFEEDREWENLVNPLVRDQIFNWISKYKDKYQYLIDESKFISYYKKSWELSPYPPMFITTDAFVLCKGHILLIKRKMHPGKDLYAVPGGHLNQHEYLKDCAIRELKEETKIDVARPILENSIKRTKVFDDPLRDPRGRYVTHAFIFELNLKDLPDVKADDDAKEVMWIPFNRVNDMQDQFYADHYQMIKNILSE